MLYNKKNKKIQTNKVQWQQPTTTSGLQITWLGHKFKEYVQGFNLFDSAESPPP